MSTSNGDKVNATANATKNVVTKFDGNNFPFEIDVTLSRQTYRVGGTIVGTVRLTPKIVPPQGKTPSKWLRESIESLLLFAVGYCRLDPRWHSQDDYTSQVQQARGENNYNHLDDLPNDLPVAATHTAPIWASYPVLDLMKLQERTAGKWHDVKPKPIILPGRRKTPMKKESSTGSVSAPATLNASAASAAVSPKQQQQQQQQQQHRLSSSYQKTPEIPLEVGHLAFTFRVDIPENVPHTLVATSCRYYYTISLRLLPNAFKNNADKKNTTTIEPLWIQIPITILTAKNNNNDDASSSFSSSPRPFSIQAMAHSAGLSSPLTANELHKLDGQWSVHRKGASLYRHLHPQAVQSMRVVDPHTSIPVCVLTMIGATNLHPGSRLVLKLDFPSTIRKQQQQQQQQQQQRGNRNVDDSTTNTKSDDEWLACYQASACLQGEEVVVRHAKKTAQQRIRARKHLFATAHTSIDPLCIESVSLDLVLPRSAPCSVKTNAVEISIQCIIDLAIGKTTRMKKGEDVTFRNLHLEIPCHVTHSVAGWESHDDDDAAADEGTNRDLGMYSSSTSNPMGLLGELMHHSAPSSSQYIDALDPCNPEQFHSTDIMDELKILSLCMADQCNLRPKPPSQRAEF